MRRCKTPIVPSTTERYLAQHSTLYTNYFHLFLIPIWRIIFHRIPKMLLYILSLIM